MLIVMKNGNTHLPLQSFFDFETGRRRDVFEIDPAERRFQYLDGADELLGVPRVDLEVEDVDVGESLEEDRLSLHHRLAGRRADIAKAQNGGAGCGHGYQVR